MLLALLVNQNIWSSRSISSLIYTNMEKILMNLYKVLNQLSFGICSKTKRRCRYTIPITHTFFFNVENSKDILSWVYYIQHSFPCFFLRSHICLIWSQEHLFIHSKLRVSFNNPGTFLPFGIDVFIYGSNIFHQISSLVLFLRGGTYREQQKYLHIHKGMVENIVLLPWCVNENWPCDKNTKNNLICQILKVKWLHNWHKDVYLRCYS